MVKQSGIFDISKWFFYTLVHVHGISEGMNKDTADNTIDCVPYYYKLPIDRKDGNSPLRTFSTQTTSQRQIFRLNRYTLGVDGS
jgi:hypothetical protein